MRLYKEVYMEHKIVNDDRLPVYDAEIVDEREEEAKVMPVKANLPEKKIAYRLGKAAGAIFTALGLFNQFRRMLSKGYTGSSGSFSGSGRGMGIRKRNRRKGKMRRFT